METYLLTVALARHRLIMPQLRANTPRSDTLAESQHTCESPALTMTPVVEASNHSAMQRLPR